MEGRKHEENSFDFFGGGDIFSVFVFFIGFFRYVGDDKSKRNYGRRAAKIMRRDIYARRRSREKRVQIR